MKRSGASTSGEGSDVPAKRGRSSAEGTLEEDMYDDAPEIRPEEEEDEWDDDTEAYLNAMGDSAGTESAMDTLDNIPETSKAKWCRKAVRSTFDPAKEDLSFQQMDTDYYTQAPRQDMPAFARKTGAEYKLYGGVLPIMRLYGVTADGHSVVAHIHGYEPYFYVQAPADFTPQMCIGFAEELNRKVADRVDNPKKTPDGQYVRYVEMGMKQTIWNYRKEDAVPFLKVVMMWPQHVTTAKGCLEQGINLPVFGMRTFLTYESNVQFVMRYMVDTDIVGANWVTLPAGTYMTRSNKTSTCQIEADVMWDKVVSHAPEGEWLSLAPLRILSFDIECAGRKGFFPEAEKDPVIQIANWIQVQGEAKPRLRNIFTLDTCAPISGAEVYCFKEEREMLKAWREFVVASDPDLLTGYNIVGFDIPYLIDRAKALKVEVFGLLGRISGSRTRVKKTTFSSAQMGVRETNEITIDGRVIFDVLQAVQRDQKLHSYTLNAVCAKFLGEQKEDVHHSIISDLQNGDAETRRRLAVYCIKDALLPLKLMEKLMFIFNYIEMARVTGVPVGWLLVRGQMLKVMSQLLRKAKQKNLLLPNIKVEVTDEKFEGATVIEPKKGFYAEPIATLDFASLYPSIMMAHNLCYTTLVSKEDVRKNTFNFTDDEVTKTPNGDTFVKPTVKKGILPEVLDELLSARKRAKADLKKESDPMKKAVLDGRQLALKISANSVYGFTGAQVGKLPCLEISSSVTAFGREMIEMTKAKVEERYTVGNGYLHDTSVVYGDTDSVMIKFGYRQEDAPEEEENKERWMVNKSMELAVDAADFVNQFFIKPIKLEFEKVYYPYLLMNKKRYAALLWTQPDNFDKMDCKGIETVRRDNCGLVRTMVDNCLKIILMQRNPKMAADYVKSVIKDLLMNKVDISELIVTKALHHMAEDAKVSQAHVILAQRMKERDANTAPVLGDRVPYVIIKGIKGAKTFEKAEDPLYVLEHNLPIDVQHYLDHHLSQPILRLFEPIMDKPQSLLSGEHTRTISIATPTTGGLMKFAKKTLTCLGCRAVLKDDQTSVCNHCKDKEADICRKSIDEVAAKQTHFSKLWTQCQRCQGSLHQEVLCTSRDCPIFYRRRKAHKDLIDAHKTLERFSLTW